MSKVIQSIPCRAYPEDVASKVANVINIAKHMAMDKYPHLLSTIEFVERRMRETEILFDKGKSELKK